MIGATQTLAEVLLAGILLWRPGVVVVVVVVIIVVVVVVVVVVYFVLSLALVLYYV